MTDEEKKAIKDCDIIFINLEDMLSEESADDYRSSYRLIKNLINNQQKEIEEKNIAINKMSKDISRQLEEIEEKSTIIMAGAEKVKRLEKEIKKYKRYFKLAISDLQSEGYMQMPYKNIEKYYSKREDIV